MDIDSDKVKALYQLSIDKTFSKASRSLGITQPALSKKINRLEDELSSNLAIRGTKEILLTETGKSVIQYYKAKKDLDIELLNKLSTSTGKQIIGEINIATYSSIGRSVVLPCLQPLILNFKNLRVNFQIKELDQLKIALLSGEVDFILSNEEISRDNINNSLIAKEENVHIVPNKKIYPHFFLDHNQNDSTTSEFLRLQNIKSEFKRNFFDDIYGIIDAVKLGYGQAIVSKHLVKNEKKVLIRKHKKKSLAPIYLSYFNRSYFPSSHKEVIKTLESKISNFLKN